MRLTAKSIEHIKPGAKRREIPDAGCAGLYLVVQISGAKSFAVRYRYLGRPTKLTLTGVASLLEARAAATQALQDLSKGEDPAATRRAAKLRAAATVPDTVASIAQEYMQREGRRLRTADQRESILRRLILPAIGERPVETIRRSELIRLLDSIEDGRGPRAAQAALSLLRRILHWHELRSDEFKSPIIRGMARVNEKERARSRVLTDDEIRRVWNATSDAAQPFPALIRFLLLTTARRTEASAKRWDEIGEAGVWTLPAARSKTKTAVERPLSKAALALLATRPRIEGCSYVFSGNGLTPYRNFSRPKAALDAASGVRDWRIHDLRRSARSLLSRAGVNSDIAERCLGHAIGGVRGVYDRHKYLDEMRHAFEALAVQIERIVNPPPAETVVYIGRD